MKEHEAEYQDSSEAQVAAGSSSLANAGKYGDGQFGFEVLEVYQAARRFRNRAYKLAALLPESEKFALMQQMRWAAVSVTSNIAEGYGRYTWQEATHFCHNSRGSLMEVVDHINVCRDQQYAQSDHLDDLRTDALQVLQLLNGYIRYLQNKKQTHKR